MAILKKLEWDVNGGEYIARYDDGSAYAASELFVLNFESASDLDYTNTTLDIAISKVAVKETVSKADQAAIVAKLNANAAEGTLYITSVQAAELGIAPDAVSTIYVGEISGLESIGPFKGIAETTGEKAAATADDNAFVSASADDSVDAIAEVIEHEAGHLAGTTVHDYAGDGVTIDDFATKEIGSETIPAGTIISGNAATVYYMGANAQLYADGTVANHVQFLSNRGSGVVKVGNVNATISMVYTDFIGNSGTNTSGGGAFAIDNNNISFYLSNCYFSGNYASTDGGCMQDGCAATSFTVADTEFVNNSCGGNGGVIKVKGGTTSFDFINCRFSGNSATAASKMGGVAYIQAGTVKFIDCYFSGNSATYGGIANPQAGASVYLVGNTYIGTATDRFHLNGQFYLDLADADHPTSITLGDGVGNFYSLFTVNGSNQRFYIKVDQNVDVGEHIFVTNSINPGVISVYTGNGGVIFVDGATSTTVTNLTYGKTFLQGGNVYAFTTVKNDKGQECLALAKGSGNLLTIDEYTASGRTYSNQFLNNIVSGTAVVFNDLNVADLTLSATGTVIYNSAGASATINNATMSGNKGNAINNYGTMFINGGTFEKNSTGTGVTKGGALYTCSSGAAYVKNAEFIGNSASYQGGAIAAANLALNQGKLDIRDCTFTSNTCANMGGAIFYNAVNNSDTTWNVISNCTFTSNTAVSAGGAVKIQNSGTHVLIEDVTFNGNSTTVGAGFGGAVSIDNGFLRLKNVTFSGNSVSNYATSGGAIGTANACMFFFEGDVNFMTATDTCMFKGGSTIYFDITDGKATVNDASGFINTYVNWYGADVLNRTNGTYTLVTANGAQVKAKTFKVINNELGTAQTLDYGKATTFLGTTYTLTYDGSAIVLTAVADTTQVTGTTALTTSDGWLGLTNGAVNVAAGGSLTGGGTAAKAVEFNLNSAANGAGIYNSNGGTVNVSNVSFYNNNATLGAAAYNEGTMTLSNVNLRTESDTIYNAATGNMTIAGNAIINANITNYGAFSFADGAVVQLMGSAEIINYGADIDFSTANLTFNNDAVKEGSDDPQTLLVGNYTGITGATFILNETSSATVQLGKSFNNAEGETYWLGSRNQELGVTKSLVLNGQETENFYTFKNMDDIATVYSNYNGNINVAGTNTFSDSIFANDASFTITGNITMNGAKHYFYGDYNNSFGSHLNNTASVNIMGALSGDQNIDLMGITASNAAMGVYAGGEFNGLGDTMLLNKSTYEVNLHGNAAHQTVLRIMAAGGNFKASSTTNFAINADSEINVTFGSDGDGVIVERTVCGSVVGSNANVTVTGNCTTNIDGGSYALVGGAGFLQSATGYLTVNGDVNMNLSGGTYGIVYGGFIVQKSSYAANATMNGNIAITVDTSSNAADFSSIFLGSNGNGTYGSDCTSRTLTFTGNGSNLTFQADGGVSGWNGTKGTVGVGTDDDIASLVFDDFSGNFTATFIESFHDIEIKGATAVTFMSDRIDFSDVTNWKFDNGATADAGASVLDFEGQNLIFGKAGETLEVASWDVLKGDVDSFADAAGVNIFGENATFTDGAWTTGTYKLYKSADDTLSIASV